MTDDYVSYAKADCEITRKAYQERVDYLLKMLGGEISSFNSLAEKHEHHMRIWWRPEKEQLAIGSVDQMKYDSPQAIIGNGLEQCAVIAQAFRIYHCSEFGE